MYECIITITREFCIQLLIAKYMLNIPTRFK